MANRFVTTELHLFQASILEGSLTKAKREIEAAVAAASDETVEGADLGEWALGLAGEHELEAPSVDASAADVEMGTRVQVDCGEDRAGFTMNSTEAFGGAMQRPGYQITCRVPAKGNTRLLYSTVFGTGPLAASAEEPGMIVREWSWPEELGSKAFEEELGAFKADLERGVAAVAQAVEAANASLRVFAAEKLEERRAAILRQQEFLGGLSIPVKRAPQGPPTISAPPPIKPRPTPSKRRAGGGEDAPWAEAEPSLDEFYEHILEVIRAEGRGLERSPGSFAEAEEETLRDHMLVTLNTHYVGAAYAEAFNREGKTDILIRIEDHNVFIGECKWWAGAKALEEALVQLFGYLTLRDTRAALIFYVPNKDLTATRAVARETLEQREEFIEWLADEEEFSLRCRLRSPDDAERAVTVTALFVHLPKRSEGK